MELQKLKRTIARVEIDGKPNGTAFLVDHSHVATALHVLSGRSRADLVFLEWPEHDRTRAGSLSWRHLAGYDLAILELDRKCPGDVEPMPWSTTAPAEGDFWCSWGFPTEVVNGHTIGDKIKDPSLLIGAWNLRILQLDTPAAKYDLGGMSGAPCMVAGYIVGVITHQLRRMLGGRDEQVKEPSLNTLYALPITLLAASPVTLPIFQPERAPASMSELIRVAEALAAEAKASVLAKMLRAIDRVTGKEPDQVPQRVAIARRLSAATRLAVHVVWRRDNSAATELAHKVYQRLTRSAFSRTSPGLRVPVFLHSEPTFLSDSEARPIDPSQVEHSVILLLLDGGMFLSKQWRECHNRIVELSERDLSGTSLLPIGLDGPKGIAPFENIHVVYFDGTAARYQLLIALELHLLGMLTRRQTGVKERKPARLFLSYTRRDLENTHRIASLQALANSIPGIQLLIDERELASGDRVGRLEELMVGSVFIALYSSSYTARFWCRRELVKAKSLGLPIVVVDVQFEDVPRVFPYLGNVPHLKWRSEPTTPYCILEAAVFEALREPYCRLLLEDQTLLDATLRHARIAIRPPEVLDLVGDGALSQLAEPVVLYPDPPLPEVEQQILCRFAPSVRFVSPGQALAEARPLRWADGQSLCIGLSASQPDVFRRGLTEWHFEDTWLDLIRLLLLGGSNLAFGGDLREGGLTDLLLELAEQRAEMDQRDRLKRAVPIHSYLAWPLHFSLTEERRLQLIDRADFIVVPPPSSRVAAYSDTAVAPSTPEARYLWARSLTRMRQTVLENVHAIVVVGGACVGFKGRYAGVVEETFLAIQQHTPVFLLGGMGGAAAAVGEALLGKRPERLTSAFQLNPDVAPTEQAFVACYNDTIAREHVADVPASIDHDSVLGLLAAAGVPALNNGLSEDENRLLLLSPSMQEVMPVLLKGLRGLLARTQHTP